MNINFKDKKILIPLILISLVLISALVFWVSYSSYLNPSTTKYISTLKKASTDINEINDNLKVITSAAPIDSDLAKEKIPTAIDSLTKVKSDISSLEPIVKFEDSTKNLLTALDYNINFYKQVIVILQNTKAKDLNVSLDNLQKYKPLIIDNYEKVNIQNISFKVSTSTISVLDSLIQYTKDLINRNSARENNKAIANKYISSLEDTANSFYNIKANLSIFLDKARDTKNYNEILKIIDSKTSNLSSIKDTLSSIEPLEKGKNLYDDLYNILEYYKNYLSDFKNAVNSEKSAVASGKKNVDDLDKFYKDSKKDYSQVTDSINEFNDDLSVFKKTLE